MEANSQAPSAVAPSLTEALQAVQSLFHFINHQVFGLGGLLFFYSFLRDRDRRWSEEDSWYWDFWHGTIIVLGCIIICLVSQSAIFCGQLRYVYLKHKTLLPLFAQYWPQGSSFGLIMILIVFPMSRVWLFIPVVLLPIILVPAVLYWAHAVWHYRDAVRDLNDKVNEYHYVAEVAISNCRMYNDSAAAYEMQAIDSVKTALRDARLAQSIKETDFFDKASEAWTAVGRVTQPLQTMKNEAEKVEGLAQSIAVRGSVRDEGPGELGAGGDGDNEDEEEDDKTIADELIQDAENARKACQETLVLLKNAQNTISQSQQAERQTTKARQTEQQNATNMTTDVTKLANSIKDMPKQLSTATRDFNTLKREIGKAKALAVQGELSQANESAEEANQMKENILLIETSLRDAKDGAHKALLALYLGNNWMVD